MVSLKSELRKLWNTFAFLYNKHLSRDMKCFNFLSILFLKYYNISNEIFMTYENKILQN